jgi:hypothetical protein
LILGLAALDAFRDCGVARPWIQANLPSWIGAGTSPEFIIVSGNIVAPESVVSFKTVPSHRRRLRRRRGGAQGIASGARARQVAGLTADEPRGLRRRPSAAGIDFPSKPGH